MILESHFLFYIMWTKPASRENDNLMKILAKASKVSQPCWPLLNGLDGGKFNISWARDFKVLTENVHSLTSCSTEIGIEFLFLSRCCDG